MASFAGNLPLCKYRYALFVSYFGTRYNGSQRLIARGSTGQQDTIQEAIEVALKKIMPEKRCKLTAASRTDKGVHAYMNTFTLPLMDYGMPTETLKSRLNKHLTSENHDILINEAVLAPATFHPRRDTSSREYIYRIAIPDKHKTEGFALQHTYHDLLSLLPLTELYRALPIPTIDLDKVQRAMELMSGEHDFASFAASSPGKGSSTIREIEMDLLPEESHISVRDRNCLMKFYRFHIKSRAFLHNQVRRMIGAILSYATYDKIKLAEIEDMLNNPNSNSWPSKIILAEPCGLYLSKMSFSKGGFNGTIKTYKDQSEESVSEMYCENEIAKSDDNERADVKNTN